MVSIRTAMACAAATLGFLAGTAGAADYPAKTITLVVPYPPGGVVDIVGRVVAQHLGATLGQQVIVENISGAAGTIGAARVAKAQPDGYTVMLGGAATQVFAPALYKDLPYDPVRSFTPIAQVSAEPLVLVVGSSLPIESFAQFVAYVKAHGDTVNFASNGPGTFPHLCAELLKQASGIRATHIPYPGGAQSMVALISGDATFSVNHMPVVLPQIRGGKVRPLAVTATHRSALLPDVPTFQELGIDLQASAWWGLYAPAGTPAPIVAKLNASLDKVLQEREVKEALLKVGDEVVGGTPQQLADYQRAETARWPAVIRAAGVKVN
jgi:tripartite-type tricarboxylate transporter receptor subunit TctC